MRKFRISSRIIMKPPFYVTFITIAIAVSTSCWNSAAQERPLYLDTTKPIEARVDDLLGRLTLEEKVSMVHAQSTFSVPGVERLGIPELWMDDGPMGVRQEVGEGFRNLDRQDDASTAMPATLGLAATFNKE